MDAARQIQTTGIVKWFDNAKGYGFIIGPDNADVMIHYKEIDAVGFRTLSAGDEVEYRATLSPSRGWKADYAVRLSTISAQKKAA